MPDTASGATGITSGSPAVTSASLSCTPIYDQLVREFQNHDQPVTTPRPKKSKAADGGVLYR